MDNLEIVTNKIVPAKVEFNYKQIESQLDIVLEKYKGLVFTEETAKDCKKTMAELRKGQKALDDFRKRTKKELTESVKEFEDDCKMLYKRFDEVLNPLKEQADLFEIKRREEKETRVREMIEDTATEFELDEKRNRELVIEDGFLIASISYKKIQEALDIKARELKEVQDQEELDVDFIIETIENANRENGINLLRGSYIDLMQVTDVSRIISKIHADINKLIKIKADERRRREEAERKIEEEKQRKIEEDERLANIVEEEIEIIQEDTNDRNFEEQAFNPIEFEELPRKIETITKTYKITGNAEQIKSIENLFNAVVENWEVI